MRRLLLLLGVCFVMALMIVPVAGAQTSGGQAAIAGGAPLPPEYVVYSDGNITIGGDVGTGCYTFVNYRYPQTVPVGQRDAALAVADACQRLGNPEGDRDPSDAEVILSTPANPPPGYDATGEVLPDTGGFPLLSFAASLALIGAGGSLLKRSLNHR